MPDRTKPKTEETYKNTKPDIMQVFDSTNMPHMFGGIELTEIVARNEPVNNDTYFRWYPDRADEMKIGEYEHFQTKEQWEAGKLFNDWLLAHSMVIEKTFCFHVIIKFSW